MKSIEEASQSLLEIINDILDFSRIEAGKFILESIPFKLKDILVNLSNLFSVKTKQKGLELIFDVSNNIPHVLIGDPLRLSQILTNLTNNAVKFTGAGQIIIKAHEQKAQSTDQIILKFSVIDTGIGMTHEHMDKLFQPFSQADTSTTRKFGGSGLGLSICKRFVNMMGGDIHAISTYGIGSTFTFTAKFGLKIENQKKSLPCHDDKEVIRENNNIIKESSKPDDSSEPQKLALNIDKIKPHIIEMQERLNYDYFSAMSYCTILNDHLSNSIVNDDLKKLNYYIKECNRELAIKCLINIKNGLNI